MRKARVVLAGNVQLLRMFCEDCQEESFVIKGCFNCCDRPVEVEVGGKCKRLCEAEQRRRKPPSGACQAVLAEQQNRCYYCERRFGSVVWRRSRLVRLKVNYDHLVPYSLTQNNRAENFVAACHVCNGLKSDYVFTNLEEAQLFLSSRWMEKGYADLGVAEE